MADAPKGENGYDVLYQVIGVIIVIYIVGTILARFGIGYESENFEQYTDDGQVVSEQASVDRVSSLSSTFLDGKISLGEKVITRGDISVHRNPAGRIIGEQNKREVGKVLEGPANTDNLRWWRIDFEQAPDGWVNQNDITSRIWAYRLLNIIPIFFSTFIPFFILLSIILVVLIIVTIVKVKNLEKLKQKKLDHARGKNIKEEIKEVAEQEKEDGDEKEANSFLANLPTGDSAPKTSDVHNKRWAKVETLINSHNVNDWKQAIIESDIILDEMLEKMGYKGDTIAEKLKQVEESDFLTLNQAWEAHKIRNKIAHKGDYVLSKSDADRAISLFREVFEEFYFI